MAVGDAYVFSGFLTPVLTQLSFQSHRLLFSHISAEVRGKNMPERKFASTVHRTCNHQVMSPTLTTVPLERGPEEEKKYLKSWDKGENAGNLQFFFLFYQCFTGKFYNFNPHNPGL